MLNVIRWQLAAALMAVCIGGLLAGIRGAFSAGLAALAVLIPSCWFAVRLAMLAQQGKASPVAFLLGEFVKIAAIIVLLALLAGFGSGLHWPALLLGMAMVLQANFLAFWKKI
ncbi:MAG: ATP synthase subunit I [Zoogloeaceae bacterium]|jgi:ATP synthase protein I|nr:ATP synthase subunit I [Zoogloeaceae bacterium]